jgi:hypothetical protein
MDKEFMREKVFTVWARRSSEMIILAPDINGKLDVNHHL